MTSRITAQRLESNNYRSNLKSRTPHRKVTQQAYVVIPFFFFLLSLQGTTTNNTSSNQVSSDHHALMAEMYYEASQPGGPRFDLQSGVRQVLKSR
jgi:hypothetical protein